MGHVGLEKVDKAEGRTGQELGVGVTSHRVHGAQGGMALSGLEEVCGLCSGDQKFTSTGGLS